jgi:hypothetical protein
LCDYQVPRYDEIYHVVAIVGTSTLQLVINGIPGDPVEFEEGQFLVNGDSLTDKPTLSYSSPGFMSHLAFYTRSLSLQEIMNHYQTGKMDYGYKDVCLNDGAAFYGMSTEFVSKAFNEVFDSGDWSIGERQNIIIDDDGFLTIPQQQELTVFDAGAETDPTFTGSKLVLGGTKYAIKSDASSAIATGAAVVAGNFTSASAPSTVKILFTIFTKSMNKYWTLKINSSNIPVLDVVQVLDEDTSDVTTYEYETAVSNGTNLFALVLDGDGIQLHSGGTGTSLNTVDGETVIQEIILVDSTTEIIMGADGVGAGPAVDSIDSLAFWNRVPTDDEFGGDYTNLIDVNLATCKYDLIADLISRSYGEWTYTFVVPFEGAYEGNVIEWDGDTSGAAKVFISYDEGPFTIVNTNPSLLPTFPLSGDIGTDVSAGPHAVKIKLSSFSDGTAPRMEAIRMRMFSDANFLANGEDVVYEPQTFSGIWRDRYVEPCFGYVQPSFKISAAERLLFPA